MTVECRFGCKKNAKVPGVSRPSFVILISSDLDLLEYRGARKIFFIVVRAFQILL